MKKQSFLKGSLLLAVSAAAAKLLGALFRIPLTSLLGGTGMGYFSCAYGLFLPLYAVLVTGLSTAVARPVADFTGRGEYNAARRVRTVARRFAWVTGMLGTAAAACLAVPFLQSTAASPEALPAVLAITPSVLLCCLTAAERGYCEGLCTMTPTALSQTLEALTKLICGLFLCKLWMTQPPAFLSGCSPEAAGACGAVLGVTLSTLAGYLCLALPCFGKRKSDTHACSSKIPTDRKLLRMLLSILLPAALGALVTNLTSLIDLVTMQRSFARLLSEDAILFYENTRLSAEIPPEEAVSFVYGAFMGLAVTVFNLVPSLTNMLAKSVLPCTAQAWAAGNRKQAAHYARQVLLLTGLAAIPAGCGIFALADGALRFLFAGREPEIQAACSSLQWLAPGVVFLCLAFPVFSLLQAVGRADLPVKVMLPGAIVKLVGNLLLIPRCYAAGAAMSTTICYAVILILALVALRQVLGEPLHLGKLLSAQVYGSLMCAGSAWLCYTRTVYLIPQKIALLLAVAVGAVVYAGVLWLAAHRELRALIK